jgi:hypothetical protein
MTGAAVEEELAESFVQLPRRVRVWPWAWLLPATLFVLPLGAAEGWYGKTVAGDVYGSDAVQYLDIARAFERGDLHSALNPLWSQGYPALLAVVRPLFRAGLEGEWNSIRALNFAIFVVSWLAFVGLTSELLRGRERSGTTILGAVCAFVTAQVCMDQVSRVGPDQLVAGFFFLVCMLLLKLMRNPGLGLSAGLGIALGLGFLAKSIFLPLGCVALAIAAIGMRRQLRILAPAAGLFAVVVLGYGAALSRAVGAPTLGEAGSLNYAWHVNRLAKWVHWEGGADPADKAWPRPWIARFAHWDTDPPDFGRPVHPDVGLGTVPTVYVFHAPVEATYVPYFDPPYWYQGYRHIVRWRYQVVALGKNVGDLLHVLVVQPFFWALSLAWLVLWRGPRIARDRSAMHGAQASLLAAMGVALYLPVHLEGRYLAPFLAVLAVALLAREGVPVGRQRLAAGILVLGFAAGLVKDQHEVWARARRHWNYRDNLEWREGRALRAAGIAPGNDIGVIAWGPNVQCDWAYLAGVRITSEIASGPDEKAFWDMDEMDRNTVLLRFRQAGAIAVVTRDEPRGSAFGWEQVGDLPMWVYRF